MSDTERPTRESVDEALRMAKDTAFTRSKQHPVNVLVAELLALRAELAARTPQPAEDDRCASCGHLQHSPDLRGESTRSGLCNSILRVGAGSMSRCQCAVFVSSAPLPAVPDGETVEDLREQLARAHALNRAQHRELVQLTMVPPLPFGEDVPARLDAAAEAMKDADPGLISSPVELRRVAEVLRRWVSPDVRAAVAAALARPTGDPS